MPFKKVNVKQEIEDKKQADEEFRKAIEREDVQIIGADLAGENSEDWSAISSVCGNCNTIIESNVFDKGNPQSTIFKRCPVCGIKFTKHIINEYSY